ncbi:MAG: glucokinase [Pseudohongiellaceae bacterium]
MNTAFQIIADVGGTHVRFAVITGADARLQRIAVYRCAEFGQLADAIDFYIKKEQELPPNLLTRLGLALPGAVHTDPVELVNIRWSVSRQALETRFGCAVTMINDFTAQALAIPALQEQDLQWLRRAAVDSPPLTRAIIGPGTGLGVAALLPGGEVVDSEAGHISFAPTSTAQQRMLEQLWQWFPRVSIERLLSGPGLANLYRAKSVLAGHEQVLSAEEITANAKAGDLLCLNTIDEFNRVFGSVCGDLALALGATGGVYLSGGIIEKLGPLFDRNLFMQEFDKKGRYSDYCHRIPLALVTCAYPGLLGMARYMTLGLANRNAHRVAD